VSRFQTISAPCGLAVLMGEHGQALASTYTPRDGDPVSLTAVWGAELVEEDAVREGTRQFQTRTVLVSTDPDSPHGGVTDPALEDRITHPDGTVWSVADFLARSGVYAKLIVTRSQMTGMRRHDLQRDRRGSKVRDPRRFQT